MKLVATSSAGHRGEHGDLVASGDGRRTIGRLAVQPDVGASENGGEWLTEPMTGFVEDFADGRSGKFGALCTC